MSIERSTRTRETGEGVEPFDGRSSVLEVGLPLLNEGSHAWDAQDGLTEGQLRRKTKDREERRRRGWGEAEERQRGDSPSF
jgi:hypothetical protein